MSVEEENSTIDTHTDRQYTKHTHHTTLLSMIIYTHLAVHGAHAHHHLLTLAGGRTATVAVLRGGGR